MLKRLPDPFVVFRIVFRWMLRRELPPVGWDLVIFDTIPSLMTCLSRLHPAICQTRAARTRWGLDDSRVPERWRTGLRLLSDWHYYVHDEPRLDWYKWLRYVPFVHDFRVLRYRLGDKNPGHD